MRISNILMIQEKDYLEYITIKDRTEAEIALVDNHEQCHHFINMREEHFCD